MLELLQRLQNWFYNNRENNGSRGSRPTPIVLNAKQKRTLSAIQLYSAEMYDKTIKPGVMDEIQKNNVPKNKTLEVVRRHTAERFSAEPLEVQRRYQEQSDRLKHQRLEEKTSAQIVNEPTPASYDKCVGLAVLLALVFNTVYFSGKSRISRHPLTRYY